MLAVRMLANWVCAGNDVSRQSEEQTGSPADLQAVSSILIAPLSCHYDSVLDEDICESQKYLIFLTEVEID